MFRVKICGVTNELDARNAAFAGADAVGLNFFSKSRRYVSLNLAAKIAVSIPREVLRVGVFVNPTFEEVKRTSEAVGLDVVQLHGDEPPGFAAKLGGRVIKAFRFVEDWTKIDAYIASCLDHGSPLCGVLIDSAAAGAYGGTGTQANWSAIVKRPLEQRPRPLILAGGLTCENVSQAINEVHPFGVDVASGVEIDARTKSFDLMSDFVARARQALNFGP